MVKMIVTDLDLTLLRSDGTLSERTRAALEKCRNNGITIAFATARSEYGASNIVDIVKPDAVIYNNGAEITIADKPVFKKLMPEDIVSGIIKMCKNSPSGGEITVQTENEYYWNYKVKPSGEYGNAIYNDFTDFKRAAYKVVAQIDDYNAAKYIAESFPNVIMTGFFGENWRCFRMSGADKASAVKRLCSELNIPLSETMAFGDDYGDIEMLSVCGISAAMGNAVEEAKKAASIVILSNDEDGVARYIEKNLL